MRPYKLNRTFIWEWICTLINNYSVSFSKSSQRISDTDATIGVITTKAAQEDGIVHSNIIYIDNRCSYDKSKYVRNNDILISLANSIDLVGRVTYVDKIYEELLFGAFMGVIRPDTTKINPIYLYYILRSTRAKDYFRLIAKTTTNISNLSDGNHSILVMPMIDNILKDYYGGKIWKK